MLVAVVAVIVVVCSQLLFLLSIFISNYSLVSAVSFQRGARGRVNCELSIVELLIVNCCLSFGALRFYCFDHVAVVCMYTCMQ